MGPDGRRPPARAARMLAWLLRGPRAESVLGDLEEEYRRRAAGSDPAVAARWYRRQALGAVLAWWHPRSVVARGALGGGPRLRLAAGALAVLSTAALVGLILRGPGGDVVFVHAVDGAGDRHQRFTFPEVLALRRAAGSFVTLAGFSLADRVAAVDRDDGRPVRVARVSGGFFEALGVQPGAGRPISAAELETGAPVALASHAFWTEALGGSRSAIGRTLTVSGPFDVTVMIVGVMPAGFAAPPGVDLWMPASPRLRADTDREVSVVGRLTRGVSIEAASAEVASLVRNMRSARYGPAAVRTAWVTPEPDAGRRWGRTACRSAAVAAVADSVADRFRLNRFVFIGSTHGGVKRHQLLLCLLSRPAFQARVTDIIVEFASGAHQELLDRYLLDLQELPPASLRALAFDTDHPPLFATIPQVPEFLQAVRAVNERVELARRVRVLGGSETADWSTVRTREDLAPFPFKTNYTAHLITEHLAPDPGARALVVYGDGHIRHGNGTLTANVEAELDPDSLFVIGTITALADGEREAVEAFGNPDRPFYISAEAFPAVARIPDGLIAGVTTSRAPRAEPARLAEKIDALVYLGPAADTNLMGSIPFSPAEQAELARRDSLRGRGTMEIRYGGRERWFARHPHDVPPDPRR